MNQAESRLLTRLPDIEEALDRALAEGAGERMGFILVVVPLNRVGEHIVSTNIAENSVVAKFLVSASRVVRLSWKKAQTHAETLAKRVLN